MNYVFENINGEQYLKIKEFLLDNFSGQSLTNIPHTIESLKFPSQKVSLIYYNSLKVMVQGSSSELDTIIRKMKEKLKLECKSEIKKKLPSQGEHTLSKEFIIGFDESGRGETFGSLFVGGVKVSKADLDYLYGMVGSKNMRTLSFQEIESLFNAVKNKFEYFVERIPANEIDSMSLTVLLDRKNLVLIDKLSENPSNEAFIFDDYGVGFELADRLDEFRSKNAEVIVEPNADVNFVASSLASLVARRARLLEMKKLSQENVLIDPDTGKRVYFISGSASNEETKLYLITFRKLFPYSDLPPFVRKKWANVKTIEEEYPKKNFNLCFECTDCGKQCHKLCIYLNPLQKVTELFCPLCGKEIKPEEIKGFFSKNPLIIDTSSIISRVITKDLNTSQYFEGCKFIIPSMLYEELDSKQPSIKVGGNREIEELRNFHEKGRISLEEFDDIEDYSDVMNDKKFMRVIRFKNGIMFTKDWNLSGFSELGAFVVQIVEDKKSYFKKINKNRLSFD